MPSSISRTICCWQDVNAIVERADRRQSHTDSFWLPGLQDLIHYLCQEADAIRGGATVEIGALVRSAPQKLVDEVTVGSVDLDSVEACLPRIRCRCPIVRQRLGDAVEGQRNRLRNLRQPSRNESLTVGPNRRRGDRRKMWPPLAWTASTISPQRLTCCGE